MGPATRLAADLRASSHDTTSSREYITAEEESSQYLIVVSNSDINNIREGLTVYNL